MRRVNRAGEGRRMTTTSRIHPPQRHRLPHRQPDMVRVQDQNELTPANTKPIYQKLNRPCNSITRPASAPGERPKFGSVTFVLELANGNDCRFSRLKTLKKFALTSRLAPSFRNRESPNRLESVRSTSRYFGPRKELR